MTRTLPIIIKKINLEIIAKMFWLDVFMWEK